jgi:hypothetical protein
MLGSKAPGIWRILAYALLFRRRSVGINRSSRSDSRTKLVLVVRCVERWVPMGADMPNTVAACHPKFANAPEAGSELRGDTTITRHQQFRGAKCRGSANCRDRARFNIFASFSRGPGGPRGVGSLVQQPVGGLSRRGRVLGRSPKFAKPRVMHGISAVDKRQLDCRLFGRTREAHTVGHTPKDGAGVPSRLE